MGGVGVNTDRTRVVAILVLGVALVVALAGVAAVALFTDRPLSGGVGIVAGLVVLIAALAGWHLVARD